MNKPNAARSINPDSDLIEQQESEEYKREELRREAQAESISYIY